MERNKLTNDTSSWYAEVGSAYLVHDIVRSDLHVARRVVAGLIGKAPESSVDSAPIPAIEDPRRTYLRLRTTLYNRPAVVVIECCVEDVLETDYERVVRRYERERARDPESVVYVVYLTLFTQNERDAGERAEEPPTFAVYQRALDSLRARKLPHDAPDGVFHVSWREFHAIIRPTIDRLSPHVRRLVEIHRDWIESEGCRSAERRRIS